MTADQTSCTIVMYHYVRDGGEYPNINALNISKFFGQLNFIRRNYRVVGLDEYAEFLSTMDSVANNLCVLTFDDGLKDHYANVFPILQERGLTGSFFPMTQPLSEHVVPPFHKLHFLLAKIGSRMSADQFNLILRARFPDLLEEHYVDGKVKREQKYKWDDNLTANLKYSVATLPSNVKKNILDQLFLRFFEDEREFCEKLYMGSEEMKEMIEGGMSFGGHSHTHPMLSELSVEEQRNELRMAKTILDRTLGRETRLFSYPYGNFNEPAVSILKSEGYKCAVTTDSAVNVGRVDPFRLGRLDTNDLPFE